MADHLECKPPGSPGIAEDETRFASEAPSASRPRATPEQLWSGRIRVSEELAQGGMSYVLRGSDTKLRRDLALKVTPLPHSEMPKAHLARFVEEAQITAQLEHPNIVPVHDYGVSPDGRIFFSMKLVRGRSLESILYDRSRGDPSTLSEFGLRRLLDVFLQVCQAIEYAHARGVIHRDLKPANIMVGDYGEVLVVDWGVAKLLDKKGPTAVSTSSGQDTTAEMASSAEETGDAPAVEAPDDPSTPLALEAVALQLLEKNPDKRLPLAQVRTHIQDYFEGIGRDYRRPGWWSSILWSAGGLALFAFLVWYLTGQSIAALFVLAPPTVLNAVGWFLFVLALGYPVWAAAKAVAASKAERDRFQVATQDEIFVSGFLAHRTLAAAVAPLLQLVFLFELVLLVAGQTSLARPSASLIPQIKSQLRAEWAQSLIVIVIFLFGYLLSLFTEVRFARRIDRYEPLVDRPRWESVWPVFLILVLLLTIGATDVLDWALARPDRDLVSFLRELVLTQPVNMFDIGKTLVFQGTFLLGLAAGGLLLAFPVAEVLAALRLPYQSADEASVRHRAQYFLRSLAVFRVARVQWLYGGAMIGSLTALTILSGDESPSLVEQVFYILGPSVIGFLGYTLTKQIARGSVESAPAVAQLVERSLRHARLTQDRANAAALAAAPWRHRLLALLLPVICIAAYLLWTGSGFHQQAIQKLIMPVTTKGWLLILPYVLLVPTLLLRDPLQLWLLRRKLSKGQTSTTRG